MLVHRRVNVTPIIKFAGTHWYTCEYKVGLNPDRSIKSKSVRHHASNYTKIEPSKPFNAKRATSRELDSHVIGYEQVH